MARKRKEVLHFKNKKNYMKYEAYIHINGLSTKKPNVVEIKGKKHFLNVKTKKEKKMLSKRLK